MEKYGKSDKSGSMDSPRGMCSHKGNPLKQPSRTPKEVGPSSNPDAQKANRLLQQANKEWDSLRGKSGM